jgi:penicillin-binding protein 1A
MAIGGNAAVEGGRGGKGFWLKGLGLALVLWLVACAAVAWWALRDVPWREIAAESRAPRVELTDAQGNPIIHSGPYQAGYASLDQYPQHLIDAVVAIEDRRFFDHRGIDLRGVVRAFVRNMRAGTVLEGGSTITQQLAKVLYLEPDRTIRRKLQEVVIAIWLDASLEKEEILTRYLNNIYLGAGATGVPAAARVYFGKEPADLTLMESAVIAGLIRAPSVLNPRSNPDGALARASVVLGAMVDAGLLEPEAADPSESALALDAAEASVVAGGWFADWALAEGRSIAANQSGGITMETTFEPQLQALGEEIVRQILDERGEAAGASQAALVAMRPDGAVVAMVGGRDYEASSFNRAVTAMRQPGSTFKTFVYYAALEAGIRPNDLVLDAPIEVAGWAPENFGGEFFGRVTVAEAFARSLNAATVALAETVGIDAVAKAARDLGIDADLMETPSLALGASEVSLLDLTGAYASIRAGVAPIEPWGINAFRADAHGRSFRVGPSRRPQIDMSAHQQEMVAMMQLAVERGTGRRAALDEPVAGKTGTSQNFRDAWFVGFTSNWVVGVWVGNDDGTAMNEVTGGGLPAEIWRAFVAEANELFPGGIDPATPRAPVEPQLSAPREDLVAQAAPACNVSACSRRYRSFRAEDCTYQPYRGSRRMCDIEAPGSQMGTVAQTRGEYGVSYERTGAIGIVDSRVAAPQSCNVSACSRAYRSFRAEDCSYQPYRGARRMCTR